MKRPWMPLYVGDYLADTGHLSTAEHGCYLLLIMHYWQNGSLPDDDIKLARICRCRIEDWRRYYREAMVSFFQPGWGHTRLETELTRAAEISNKRKAAALQMHSKHHANADTITVTVTKTEEVSKKERVRAVANATSTNESEGAFEEFRRAYPKRKGAMGWQLAKRHFLKAIKAGENPQAIIAGARGYAAAESENVGTPFIKQASAWMNQECWKDYAETARKPQNTLSYEELKAQWLAKQGKANAERTELGTTAPMVEAELGDCEFSRDSGGNQARLPRIQRMDEVLSRRNGANSTLHEASEDDEQGSDTS